MLRCPRPRPRLGLGVPRATPRTLPATIAGIARLLVAGLRVTRRLAGLPVDGQPERTLDLRDVGALVGVDERHDGPSRTGACRAARPVRVVLRVVGRIEVHDARDAVDVDPTCGDVRRDERLDLAVRERGERLVTLVLRPVAVDHRRLHAGATEVACDPVGAALRAAEHDRRSAAALDRVDALLEPVVGTHALEVVVDRARLLFTVRRAVHDGVRLVPADEHVDRVVEGRREQHRLTLGRRLVEELLHLREEAHVGHAVGFVEDDDLDRGQLERLLTDQVGETARAGDDDVDALAERLALGFEAHAAVDRERSGGPWTVRASRAHAAPGRRALGWGRARGPRDAWACPWERARRAGCRTRASCPSRCGHVRRRHGRRGRRGW